MTGGGRAGSAFPWAAVISAVMLSGCAQTSYRAYESAGSATPLVDREVRYALDREYYADSPACVAVMPAKGDVGAEVATGVERSMARYLSQRVSRVISPLERRRIVREGGLDLARGDGRRLFAGIAGCAHFAEAEIKGAENTFVGVWSQRSIDLTLRLGRNSDGKVLWRAAHVASRSDGGLPLSAFSVAFNAIEAARFQNDDDVVPSMIDDVVRRIFVTLPDMR